MDYLKFNFLIGQFWGFLSRTQLGMNHNPTLTIQYLGMLNMTPFFINLIGINLWKITNWFCLCVSDRAHHLLILVDGRDYNLTLFTVHTKQRQH